MFSSTLTRGARIRSLAVFGTFVAAIVFFGSERLMRDELPRLIPGGELSAVRAPRMRVRTRMLVAFLLLGLLPLAVLSMAALTRADALRTADAATAAAIIHNLNLVIIVLALGGVVVSVALALLVAASVARPLSEVQAAMAQVQRGGLDARCGVVSNDEIGAVAEGFNAMVRGLREREAIRETFGRYVSPEVRDEILAGRVSGAGVPRDVTILFADLRDFTPWVEASPPAEVVADLNAYFSEMDAAIRAHGGLVLQFIGDEIENKRTPRLASSAPTRRATVECSTFSVRAAPDKLPSRPPLSLDVARKIASAAEAEAKANGWPMVIAVMDSGFQSGRLAQDGPSPDRKRHDCAGKGGKRRAVQAPDQGVRGSTDDRWHQSQATGDARRMPARRGTPADGGAPVSWSDRCFWHAIDTGRAGRRGRRQRVGRRWLTEYIHRRR
jgi:class 3 adenylate cyclase